MNRIISAIESMGYAVKPQYEERLAVYLNEMIERERAVVVQSEDGIEAIITFFITEDHEKLANKPEFSIPNDNPYGHEIYIDKMIAHRWDRRMRKIVVELMEDQFPQARVAFWHKSPNNRCIRIYKRGIKA